MKTQRTLYVSDLDGTLLNRKTIVSERSVNLLNKLIHKHGLLFSIATARTPATVVALMERIDTQLPFILMSGATMWDNTKRKFLNVRSIEQSLIETLLPIFERHQVHPFLYLQQGDHIRTQHVEELNQAEYTFIHPRTICSPYKRLQLLPSLTANIVEPVMLVCATGNYDALNEVYQDICSQRLHCSLDCFRDVDNPEQGFLEIHSYGTTKALALKKLANEVQADRVVVFGDNLNDISMMKVADHSVCVANAFDEVKQIADEQIGTNDEDAVVRWIENDLKQNSF